MRDGLSPRARAYGGQAAARPGWPNGRGNEPLGRDQKYWKAKPPRNGRSS